MRVSAINSIRFNNNQIIKTEQENKETETEENKPQKRVGLFTRLINVLRSEDELKQKEKQQKLNYET